MIAEFSAKHDSDVPPEGWRSATEIDSHIEYFTRCDPNQLGLGCRRNLKMQPAQNTLCDRKRMVFLDKMRVDSVLLQQVGAKNLRKKSS